MSCCGQSSAQAQANGAALIDEGATAGALTKLVYVGSDRRTQPFVVEGKIYQFGNNARRRVNAVSARIVPTFLQGPWAVLFAVFDPALYHADGTLIPSTSSGAAGSTSSPTGKPGKAKGAT